MRRRARASGRARSRSSPPEATSAWSDGDGGGCLPDDALRRGLVHVTAADGHGVRAPAVRVTGPGHRARVVPAGGYRRRLGEGLDDQRRFAHALDGLAFSAFSPLRRAAMALGRELM